MREIMSLLSELTLVVPTEEHPHNALRQIRYWSGTPVTLHVLDGSSTPLDPADLKHLGSNVFYHHLPISPVKRVAHAVDLVKTPYAAWLSDDEFFIPSALEKCIEELKKNGSLVACLGHSLHFRVADRSIVSTPWAGPFARFKGYELSSDNARERVVAHMNPYLCSTVYAVTKSDVWKNNIKATRFTGCSSQDAFEIAHEMVCAYQGKSKVIDVLMWLRNSKNHSRPSTPMREWYTNSQYTGEVEDFLNTMITALKSRGTSDEFEIRSILEDAIGAFLIWTEEFNKKPEPPSARGFIRRLFAGMLFKKTLERKGLVQNTTQAIELPLMKQAEKLKRQGVKVDLKELRRIKKTLEEFHFV
jgi:glycosyltransferase domain-containing protein